MKSKYFLHSVKDFCDFHKCSLHLPVRKMLKLFVIFNIYNLYTKVCFKLYCFFCLHSSWGCWTKLLGFCIPKTCDYV